jgi:16S rRNA (cytosine1402-N4)-methyltransferase
MEFHHVSVMLNECIEGLNIKPDGTYIDGTAGGAGHSVHIAEKLSENGKLIAIDRDPDAVAVARERLSGFPAQVVQSNFADMAEIMKRMKIEKADGILLDLGVSSHQLDTPERGFSYKYDAPLDMRMSQSGLSAYDIVNGYSEEMLSKIFFEFGEEKFSRKIAGNIIKFRAGKPVETTSELAEIIKASIPAKFRREKNPCKKTFQALRIAVNGELDYLSSGLDCAFECLAQGGRLAVITFHSLEDRLVKQKFAQWCKGCTCPPEFPVCVCGKLPKARLVNRKPITASEEELAVNNRSHSAKLRIIERN